MHPSPAQLGDTHGRLGCAVQKNIDDGILCVLGKNLLNLVAGVFLHVFGSDGHAQGTIGRLIQLCNHIAPSPAISIWCGAEVDCAQAWPKPSTAGYQHLFKAGTGTCCPKEHTEFSTGSNIDTYIDPATPKFNVVLGSAEHHEQK